MDIDSSARPISVHGDHRVDQFLPGHCTSTVLLRNRQPKQVELRHALKKVVRDSCGFAIDLA
jgi:hypothetical protein